MSRLRRPFLYDRYFFVTVALLKSRRRLQDPDFERLAYALARMRRKYGFLLTARVFLPDHWHAIIYPPYPLTISRVFQAVKVSSMIAINVRLGEAGELWQGRFFDRALRTVKEYHEKVELPNKNRLAWRAEGRVKQLSPGRRPLAGFEVTLYGRF